MTVPGDYFVDTTDTAHPVLYVYNDKPGTIMVNISLKDNLNATYNITKEAASAGYYTLDKTSANAGETVTATLTEAGIAAIGTNQSMTLDYYGGLHCGERLEVLLDGEWIPTRIELGEFWYLKGVKLIKLNGLIVRIED